MSLSHSLGVFRIGMTLGMKQMWRDKITILGAFLIYASLILLYGGVMKMIPPADLAKHNLTAAQLIWYMAMTEYVLFICASYGFKEVQNDFMSEQMYLSLLRPYRTSLVRMSLWAGESLVRGACLFFPVMLFTTWLAGGYILTPLHSVGLLLSLPLSAVITLCAIYVIGASCLWFVQSEPACWIWYKSVFLFGALVVPLSFYPSWMFVFAWFTPFPAILSLAGQWALNQPAAFYALAFVHQAFWCAMALLFLRWFDGVVLRKIQAGEG